MPPSPALRRSPGNELKMENNHKRGRSLESGMSFKAKDDDLSLFNDMQMKEKANFLLQSNDDFEDSLSKLRRFSDYKVGVTLPIRGESSDLLNADGEKNDYDWLLTPPDTPLFPSLDNDEPPANLVSRGRPRSQPISISKSSLADRSQRTSRSSASPLRLSPSPRSDSTTFQSRGRAFSAPHASHAPVLRPTTPSRRSATPPNRPSTPIQRSSTPTLGRVSNRSTQASSSGRSGISPVKGTRGGSASPKLRGWQSNIPGFPSDAPPNLRTSLPDRPVSYTRGSSPASRNGKDLSSRNRQSMSPTASRSVSSSHSHDRDRFSPHSKGSVASSGDDDVDSLYSVSTNISASPTARKNGMFMNSRTMTFPKKTSRTTTSTSAPKRSFDSAIRQMDHRKTPQNMFRPLMSSVPTSTFSSFGKATMHHPIFSRNSSITTSSNASSDQGVSMALDKEGNEHDQMDLAGEWHRRPNHDIQEEVLVFGKMDEIREDAGQEIHHVKTLEEHENFQGSATSNIEGFENFIDTSGEVMSDGITSNIPDADWNHSETDNRRLTVCLTCRESFLTTKPSTENTDLCLKYDAQSQELSTINTGSGHPSLQEVDAHHQMALLVNDLCDQPESSRALLGSPEETKDTFFIQKHGSDSEQCIDQTQEGSLVQLGMEEKENEIDWLLEALQTTGSTRTDCSSKLQQSRSFSSHSSKDGFQLEFHETMGSTLSDCNFKLKSKSFSSGPSLKIDSSEGTGISLLLLKRSSSGKGHVVQGRAFTTSSILCAEPSYAREHVHSLKLNLSRNSSSASSSLDLGPSRQMDNRIRQLSNRKDSIDHHRRESNSKHPNSLLSDSVSLDNSLENFLETQIVGSEKNNIYVIHSLQCDSAREMPPKTEDFNGISMEYAEFNTTPSSVGNHRTVVGNQRFALSSIAVNSSTSESSSCTESTHLEVSSANGPQNTQFSITSVSIEDNKLIQTNEIGATTISVPADIALKIDKGEDGNISCSSEPNSSSAMHTKTSPRSSAMEMPFIHSLSVISEKKQSFLLDEFNYDCHDSSTLEDSSATVEGSKGQKPTSLMSDEPTDTILVCNSLVHDLAREAADIATEKEQACVTMVPNIREASVLMFEKPILDKEQGRTLTKRNPKSQKTRRKSSESEDVNVPPSEPWRAAKVQKSPPCNTDFSRKFESEKPPKLESKCNCTIM